MKPQRKFYTVVYEITDDQKFQEVAAPITAMLASEAEQNGCKVTGCGFGDVMTEKDAYKWVLLEEGYIPEDILEDFLVDAGDSREVSKILG